MFVSFVEAISFPCLLCVKVCSPEVQTPALFWKICSCFAFSFCSVIICCRCLLRFCDKLKPLQTLCIMLATKSGAGIDLPGMLGVSREQKVKNTEHSSAGIFRVKGNHSSYFSAIIDSELNWSDVLHFHKS